MQLQFVNHASFILRCGGTTILHDPWLWGSAFNDGWDLICESSFDDIGIESIDYIWYSHEHPDHFSPGFLKRIPEDRRARITVLFQKTPDAKVAAFCARLGFPVLELVNHKSYTLGDSIEVRCGQVPFLDSWICYRSEGQKLLNLNDCVVRSEADAEALLRQTGTVDVLLTQFSYAAWKGNPEDRAVRLGAARGKLDAIYTQIQALKPTYTIPFASFVYFSHVENRYMNDGVNLPRSAAEAIEAAGSKPVVMLPGTTWDVGEAFDSEDNLDDYDRLYASLPERTYHESQSVSMEELRDSATQYVARIRAKNNMVFVSALRFLPVLGFFAPVTIRLTDLDRTVGFTLQRGLEELGDESSADVEMHSDSLHYIFRFDWGYDTLTVNGRFVSDQKGFVRMTKMFAIGPLNNIGKSVGFRLLFDVRTIALFLRVLWKFVRTLARSSSQTPSNAS